MKTPDGPLWVFGYGSLVWKPRIAFDRRLPARLPGMLRRFWQGSEDHRGTPGAPGRVVTLVEAPGEHCWGMTFRVVPEARAEVLAALDHREQGGYERSFRTVYDRGGARIAEALVYVATPDNALFLGDAPVDAMAEQILASTGPSGPNDEYVLRLSEALREMDVEDDHVFELAARVAALRR